MHLFSKILLSHPTGCAIIKNCLRRKKPAFCTGAKDRMIKLKVKLLVQIGIVFGICLVGEGIAAILPFAFPASVLSMLLLFVLLLCGVLKVEHIREKGDFLLKNMAFFFIPSGVALLEQVDFLKGKIMILLLICLITMVLTFAATAFTVRLVSRWQKHLKKEEC